MLLKLFAEDNDLVGHHEAVDWVHQTIQFSPEVSSDTATWHEMMKLGDRLRDKTT